jgi:hypothetical protein
MITPEQIIARQYGHERMKKILDRIDKMITHSIFNTELQLLKQDCLFVLAKFEEMQSRPGNR